MSLYATMRTAILSGSPSPVAAIVGQRVHADELPQSAELPAVVILIVAAPRIANDVSGTAALAAALVQVDCWAATRAGADALAGAVEAAVTGSLGADATLENRRDSREPQTVKEARRTMLEFNVSTTEA